MIYSKKARSTPYLTQTITDADYADDIALLANTPTQAEFQLHSQEQVAGGIGLHVNADKMEYMCFNKKRRHLHTSGSLILVGKFSYRGSSVPSSENDINMRLAKAWTAIDRLLIIWNSDYVMK